jgi:hypothetical protein
MKAGQYCYLALIRAAVREDHYNLPGTLCTLARHSQPPADKASGKRAPQV